MLLHVVFIRELLTQNIVLFTLVSYSIDHAKLRSWHHMMIDVTVSLSLKCDRYFWLAKFLLNQSLL